MNKLPNKYPLEERTTKFGEEVVKFCKKEAQETKYWLRMIKVQHPEHTESLRTLWQEAQELTLIFQKITNTARKVSI